MSDVEEQPLGSDDDVSDVFVNVSEATVRDTKPAPMHREALTQRAVDAASAWGELRPAAHGPAEEGDARPGRSAGGRQQHGRRPPRATQADHIAAAQRSGESVGPDIPLAGYPSTEGFRCAVRCSTAPARSSRGSVVLGMCVGCGRLPRNSA